MDNFTSTNGISSKDLTESSKEKIQFGGRKCHALRTTEEAYPTTSSRHGVHPKHEHFVRHGNRHSFGSALPEAHSSVCYNQEERGTRILFGAHRKDASTHSNRYRSRTDRTSNEGFRYHQSHGRETGTSLSDVHQEYMHIDNDNRQTGWTSWETGYNTGHAAHQEDMYNYNNRAHLGDMHNYNNHQTDWTSHTNYGCHPQAGIRKFSLQTGRISWESSGPHSRRGRQPSPSFHGAPCRGDFRNQNNHQKYVTDRNLETNYGHYKQHEMQRSPYLSGAYDKNVGNYNNCQKSVTNQTFGGDCRFNELTGRQKGRWHSSKNHALRAPNYLPKHRSDIMNHGKDVRQLNSERYSATVVFPTCSKDATSIADSVDNVTVVSDFTQHDFLGKGNASRHGIKEEKSETNIDSSLEGTENIFHASSHVKEATMHEASACVHSDGAVALNLFEHIEAISPNKSIFQTSRKLLVLDLNGILVDILHLPNAAQIHADREQRNVSGKTAFKRPFCDDFLNFCFSVFDIGIWSSRMKHNVEVVVDYLMGNKKKKLLFCWDSGKCTSTGFKTLDNARKPLVLKELSKLWDKEDTDLPWEKGAYSPSNTLLIDDSPYKALCNPPCTGIFPEPYSFTDAKDSSLGPGGDLRVFLEGLVKADDVQEYVRRNPIGQPCITDDGSSSWRFYQQVMERFVERKKGGV